MSISAILAMTMAVLVADDTGPIGFREQVAPILVSRCLGCHKDGDEQGNLNMSTFAKLREGGAIEGDLILLPGEPDASHLVNVLKPEAEIRMPLEQEPLSDEEIELIARWVAEGAVFDGPSEGAALASLVDPLAHLPDVAVTAEVADPVAAVAFSDDGERLAAARGSVIYVFDRSCGDPIALLEGHEGAVNSLAFGPGGMSLVAAGGRPGMFGSVAVWDLESSTKRREWRGHADAILSADLSPDGRTLATASYDRIVTLWDAETGDELRSLKEHTDAVYAVDFSRDGTRLASASGDRTVKIWEVETGRRIESLGDSTGELHAVTFGPDGSSLLAGGADRAIRRWTFSGDTGTLDRSAIAHDGAVLDLLVAPDGRSILSTGEDSAVKRWSLPDLRPMAALPRQSDWPLSAAISPSGDRLALGRYDGALVLLAIGEDGGDPIESLVLLDGPSDEDEEGSPAETEAEAPKPELVKRPSLGPPGPKGAARGTTVTVDLGGTGVGRANAVVFDDPGLVARILPSEAPDPNALRIELTIPGDARIGRHSFRVQTPLGVPAPQGFAVYEAPERPEVEPNNAPAEAPEVTWPTTLAGAIDTPGDVDHARMTVEAGREVVLADRGGGLGSTLDPIMELLDDEGRVIARGRTLLSHRAEADGEVTLRITDRQFGGSGNHFYRVEVGEIPVIEEAFPLGIAAGGVTEIAVSGRNLGGSIVSVPVPEGTAAGAILGVPATGPGGRAAEGGPRLVVAEGPQAVEAEPNDEPGGGVELDVPGGISGRIDHDGDLDHVRIGAKAGHRLIVEAFGHRLGTEVDPVIEILDAEGEPLPMAVLRPVAGSSVAFRDHNATQDRIRLTRWDELAQDDYLLIGRELTRLFALPRNPDDDAVFWSSAGRRLAYLGTTPEQHPQDRPITKVEIHPPGTTFPPGGAAPVTLHHRNDDSPGLGKDASLTFDPPRDGTYVLRVADARGLGGPGFGYHVVVREPRPDFVASLSTSDPDIPRGGAAVVSASIRRIDGFDGPVELRVEDLPEGITATSARVEPGHFAADLLLMADADAPTFTPPSWRVVAEAEVESLDGGRSAIRHELRPGGDRTGWITVTPAPDLIVRTDRDRVELTPGEQVELTFTIERSGAFAGRVPIDVRNLPHGVRVLDIGLNGVLITESEVERTVVLFAEPWVEPTERPFYGVGKVEATGTDHPAPPITLVVRPGPG